MRKYLLFAGLVVRIATAASEHPTPPSAGVIREPDRRLHLVYGFSGNLINGHSLALRDVSASSFSDTAGLVLASGSLKLVGLEGAGLGGTYSTRETQPLLSIIDQPETAIAWLPGEQKFVSWTGSVFTAVPFDASQLPGPIVALQSLVPGAVVDIWVSAQGSDTQHLRISLPSGFVTPLETTASSGRVAFVDGATLIFRTAEGLEVRSRGGASRTFAMPAGDLTFEKASAHWVHILSANPRREWMIYLNDTDAALSELPVLNAPASGGGR